MATLEEIGDKIDELTRQSTAAQVHSAVCDSDRALVRASIAELAALIARTNAEQAKMITANASHIGKLNEATAALQVTVAANTESLKVQSLRLWKLLLGLAGSAAGGAGLASIIRSLI